MAPYHPPKTAVWFITGCSTGLGHALATHLLTTKPHARIVATARNPTSLSSLPPSPNLLPLALDVTSETSIQAAIAATLEKWGTIDVLVNNAGYNVLAAAEMVDLETARGLLDTNFWGAVRVTRGVLPVMRNKSGGNEGGVVLMVSSLGGRLAFPGNSYYHASKFALEGWTEAVSKEVRPEWGIRFCCIEPGGVKTNYAKTSVAPLPSSSSADSEKKEDLLSAYEYPGSLISLLRNMHEDPAAMAAWADPNNVVRVMCDIVERGVGEQGEIPLRVPLGVDSWGLQMRALEAARGRLEGVREIAFSTTVEEDAGAVLKRMEFLEV